MATIVSSQLSHVLPRDNVRYPRLVVASWCANLALHHNANRSPWRLDNIGALMSVVPRTGTVIATVSGSLEKLTKPCMRRAWDLEGVGGVIVHGNYAHDPDTPAVVVEYYDRPGAFVHLLSSTYFTHMFVSDAAGWSAAFSTLGGISNLHPGSPDHRGFNAALRQATSERFDELVLVKAMYPGDWWMEGAFAFTAFNLRSPRE